MRNSIPENRRCRVLSLPGLVPYEEAMALQRALVQRRQAGETDDTLLLLEHPPTITLGRGAVDADLLTDRGVLGARGVAIVEVDRGGEITYHAPGQLVCYPILDLRRHGQDLHRYLRDLEEVVIRTLRTYGLNGERVPGLTGVWVGGSKIAAIGIKVSRWVTMHGLALNLDLDLTPMRRDFIPCGIRDRGVTSLAEQATSAAPTRAAVERNLLAAFADVFQVRIETGSVYSQGGLGIIAA